MVKPMVYFVSVYTNSYTKEKSTMKSFAESEGNNYFDLIHLHDIDSVLGVKLRLWLNYHGWGGGGDKTDLYERKILEVQYNFYQGRVWGQAQYERFQTLHYIC